MHTATLISEDGGCEICRKDFFSLKLQHIYQNLGFEMLLVNYFVACNWKMDPFGSMVKLTGYFSEKCVINGQIHIFGEKVLHTSKCILVFLS